MQLIGGKVPNEVRSGNLASPYSVNSPHNHHLFFFLILKGLFASENTWFAANENK